MDLSKISNSDRVQLCRRYFFIGLALLPLVWIVNFVCFFRYAFLAEPSPSQKIIRKYAIFSLVGACFWVVVITVWEVYFQIERAKGNEWTDRLSFVFPLGYV
ncbi:Gamma-secretase subunit pen-2 [Toxocara canis]|uniref:Gamma-secretase subunit PEN-2 n=1 Tax=Toxocara canis TaxID=6265 RepID=A0A0B2V661_TOXCA|nr:Gamma-secretase subunit pen-2 [Toxocara canis]KHN76465.1 Gamma-secretase subunit pen-2 [Toxocara canis]